MFMVLVLGFSVISYEEMFMVAESERKNIFFEKLICRKLPPSGGGTEVRL